jgi:6-phosphogluconolactonase
VMLGLGADAHTASLFPGSSAAAHEWASARQQPQTGQWRVTLTEPVLNATRQVIVLVAGDEKASALFDVMRGPRDLTRVPGQRIAPRGLLSLWADRAAAKRL